METKETGGDAPKSEPKAADEAKVEAKKADEVDKAEQAATADEVVKADEAKAEEAKAEEVAKAEPAAGADKPAEATEATEPAAKVEPAAPPKPSSTGTIAGVLSLVILLGGVVGTIMMARRNEASNKRPSAEQVKKKKKGPKKDTTPWNVGDKVSVSITVLPEDTDNLICASTQEIGGKHCAFESKDKVWSKDDSKDDKILLRPYATTGQRRLIASGFWSQLATPLPDKRFTAKCNFAVEGKLDHPWVKFRKTMEFKEVKEEWFAGTLTDCEIEGAAKAAAPAATK